MAYRPITLIIIDGWGADDDLEYSAKAKAQIPFYNSLLEKYPNTTLAASGEDVGLPEGQMGNSEVGHLNIGAGRVVYQDYTRINLAIRTGEILKNAAAERGDGQGARKRFHPAPDGAPLGRRRPQRPGAPLRPHEDGAGRGYAISSSMRSWTDATPRPRAAFRIWTGSSSS